MRIVYLTSGPRGAGKTTYVSLVKRQSQVTEVIDRDEILLQEFGSVSLDPYSGGHIVAGHIMQEKIKEALYCAGENSKIVVDAWNGFPYERSSYASLFRKLGADMVVCWYFVTPLETVLQWFKKKPKCAGISNRSVTWDYNLYHSEAEDINYPDHEIYLPERAIFTDANFDMICRINPLQLSLPHVNLI